MISIEYLAGLIDGEGYIAIIPNRTAREVTNPSYSPSIKIGMTGESARVLFNEITEDYDCFLEKYVRISKGGRKVYTLNMGGKQRILSFIDKLIPHLRIKQDQALLVKEFCELPYEHPKSPVFDKSVVRKRRELYEKIKDLKRADHLQRLSE